VSGRVGETDDAEPAVVPVLRVVRGNPTDEELAALVAVVAARQAAAGADWVGGARARRSAWADPARALRRPLSPGPAGWRRSALPR